MSGELKGRNNSWPFSGLQLAQEVAGGQVQKLSLMGGLEIEDRLKHAVIKTRIWSVVISFGNDPSDCQR